MGRRHLFRIVLPCSALLVLGASIAEAQGLELLHSFASPGSRDDGWWPTTGPIEGSDGVLYGTTAYGGENRLGVAFRINRDGTGYLKIHEFGVGAAPQIPFGGVIQGSEGWLYGTTFQGGDDDACYPLGCGTVFRLRTDGTDFMVLHIFTGHGNGELPVDPLVEGADGLLYGTTSGGGYSMGTVFKLGKDGTDFMTLHEFGGPDGVDPNEIFEGSDGILYGTTREGGAYDGGTVFKINNDGSGFVTLHSFDPFDRAEGSYPQTGLIARSDGALYGTTADGGIHDEGVVFKINEDGSGLSTVHEFDGLDGDYPTDLVESPEGVLYGSTDGGGAYDDGVVFTMKTDGSAFQVLHDFTGFPDDGARPRGLVSSQSDDALYGTTWEGGEGDQGTVFRLALDCKAFLQVHGEVHTPGSIVLTQIYIAHHRPKTVTVPWELRLFDANGERIARHTTAPHTFEPGDVVDRNVEFRLPDDLAAGTYTLELAIKGMAGTKGAKTTLRVVRAE